MDRLPAQPLRLECDSSDSSPTTLESPSEPVPMVRPRSSLLPDPPSARRATPSTTSPANVGSSLADGCQESSSRFRCQAKTFFLTFPRCSAQKEEVSRLLNEFRPQCGARLLWSRVVQENHEDGAPHLHLVFQFDKSVNVCRSDYFDFLATGHHCNIQSAKSPRSVLEYLSKSDPSPCDFGAVPSSARQVGKLEEIAMSIKGGASLEDVDSRFPGVYLNKKRQIDDYYHFQMVKARRFNILNWSPLKCSLDRPSFLEVLAWFNDNVGSTVPRKIKTPQLWLWGPPNVGKTSLLEFVATRARVYLAPSEDFFDSYDDASYDLALFDEFSPKCYNLGNLRKFFDGQKMCLRRKGGQIAKNKNLPCVVLSNFSIDKAFGALVDKQSFHARFLEVNIQDLMPLECTFFEDTPDQFAFTD